MNEKKRLLKKFKTNFYTISKKRLVGINCIRTEKKQTKIELPMIFYRQRNKLSPGF